MHKHGIAGALWQAARRLVTGRRGIQIAAGVVLAVAGATAASAVPVEYDYVGTSFDPTTIFPPPPSGLYNSSQSVSGYIIVNDALPVMDTILSPNIMAFEFKDGVNTISSANPDSFVSGSSFTTDASGQIISGSITLRSDHNVPPVSHKQISVLPAGDLAISSNAGTARSPAGGTWSGPVRVSANKLACIQDLTGPNVLSNNIIVSGAVIGAAFMPNGGIAKAESDCGVTHFDWAQSLAYAPPYPSIFTSGGIVPPSGTSDPPIGGWDYITARGCPNTYPYYYSPTASAGVSCGLSLFDHLNSTYLGFQDAPGDACLPLAAKATPAQVAQHTTNLALYCGGKDSSANAESFTTTLVGVGGMLPLTLYFSWGTTWNGTTGGTFQQNTDDLPDPGTGTGGVFLISVNGFTVPEPSSFDIFWGSILTLAILSLLRRRTGRLRLMWPERPFCRVPCILWLQ